jgi:hypothetical protein
VLLLILVLKATTMLMHWGVLGSGFMEAKEDGQGEGDMVGDADVHEVNGDRSEKQDDGFDVDGADSDGGEHSEDDGDAGCVLVGDISGTIRKGKRKRGGRGKDKKKRKTDLSNKGKKVKELTALLDELKVKFIYHCNICGKKSVKRGCMKTTVVWLVVVPLSRVHDDIDTDITVGYRIDYKHCQTQISELEHFGL